jgi:phosphotransferase system enzyme I (PtsI)
MEIFRGIAVAPGVAIAEAVVLDAEDYRIPQRTVPASEVDGELARLDSAIRASIAELRQQEDWLNTQLGRDAASVFEWHVGVLQDERLRQSIERLIREKHAAAAHAASSVMRNYQRRFLQMSDPLLVERIRDVQDIERRLIRHILGERRQDWAHLTEPAVLVAHDLSPSQTTTLADTKIVGVALDTGSATSHTAILLRSWGRPGVIGLADVSTRVSGGDTVIIDGSNQLVIVNPNPATLEEYETRRAAFDRLAGELNELRDLPAITRDGERVLLQANIEFAQEAAAGVAKGCDGVGLYRTEFLFLRSETMPTEDEQYEAYRQAVLGAQGRPVTIRTFDLGADKYTQQKQFEPEKNPMLGLRSIRYSLRHLEMFKTQLRAILRASVHGDIRVMFPLLVSLLEFRQAKMTLYDAMEDLEESKTPFNREIRVGIMLETPAAAIQVREFCREVDFISIGTNDLIQYLLAVDRSNERVSAFYSASHPAVLRALRDVVRACVAAGVECSLCGEMAGQPLYTMFLIGIGLRNLSMSPANVPEIKKLTRLATVPQSQRVARRALSFETERQVNNFLRDETRRLLPEDPL